MCICMQNLYILFEKWQKDYIFLIMPYFTFVVYHNIPPLYSEPTQCTMVYSRQGTTETIEEVEDEQEEEHKSPVTRTEAEEEEEEEEEDDYSADLEGTSYTPDTDLPLYAGDGDLPPSYSKAVSFEQLSFTSRDESADNILMVLSPDESHIDKLHDTLLPPLTHELTASELLLNK